MQQHGDMDAFQKLKFMETKSSLLSYIGPSLGNKRAFHLLRMYSTSNN